MNRVHRSTLDAVLDLERNHDLARITEEINSDLEMAAVHRRVHARGGPALFFTNVRGSPFPAASNLFGTMDRARYLFRHTLDHVKALIALRADPAGLLRSRGALLHAALHLPLAALKSVPRYTPGGPVSFAETTVDRLPAPRSWKLDGGPFITLPQVLTEDPDRPGILGTNMGMYRIQLSGNKYEKNRQIGLHYQIHRGIGVHHTRALAKGEPLRVSISVGGPPAHSLAAVMPLPEGVPEVAFAGALAGRRFRWTSIREQSTATILSAEADFCITGTIEPMLLPEGPFGDHLGYYSLAHDFPVLRVEHVFHRKNAVWPFTVVGRPPQEDTIFGALIHELTGPMVPASIPGLLSMHAVDAAGVHPLLLALGSERYAPFLPGPEQRPMELLTIANAILGFGQASLAKYLMIAAGDGAPDPHHTEEFFEYALRRIDFSRDLHFQTETTIDTLDYSGTSLNQGSKLILACFGPIRRDLEREMSPAMAQVFERAGSGIGNGIGRAGFRNPRIAFPGIIALEGPRSRRERGQEDQDVPALLARLGEIFREDSAAFHDVAWIVLCDDSDFLAASFSNLLWVTFTRSNPAEDVYGVDEFTKGKHWGCKGPLFIDARLKPFMAPVLEEDPEVSKRIDRFFLRGSPLAPWG